MVQQRVRQTPEQIAEDAKPAWKVVPAYNADHEEPGVQADAVLPEVSTLMNKYFGTPETQVSSDGPASANADGDSALLSMEPKEAADIRPARKAFYVTKGKVFGAQG